MAEGVPLASVEVGHLTPRDRVPVQMIIRDGPDIRPNWILRRTSGKKEKYT